MRNDVAPSISISAVTTGMGTARSDKAVPPQRCIIAMRHILNHGQSSIRKLNSIQLMDAAEHAFPCMSATCVAGFTK
jgi:hypothetical protein